MRAEEQVAPSAALLRKRGAVALVWSAISVKKIDGAVQAVIERASSYDWLLFTSVNAVRFFNEALHSDGHTLDLFQRARVCGIGKRTADALLQLGKKVDFIADQFVAESLAAAVLSKGKAGDRVLLPRARVAREVIRDALTAAGLTVDVLPIYETGPGDPPEALRAILAEGLDAVCFSSSSAATSFAVAVGEGAKLPPATVLAAIGPVTAETMRNLGLTPTLMAEIHTMEALFDALERYFRDARRPSLT